MPEQYLPTEEILELLRATPERLVSLTDGLASDLLCTEPEPREWSARDILAHLRSCSDVWGAAIGRIVAEDRPTIRAVSPRTWIRTTDYREQEFAVLLESFTEQRNELIALLVGVPGESWFRAAQITGTGRPLVWSVWHYADRMVAHERLHLVQIQQTLAALAD